MRFRHQREFYFPKGAMKFADRESSAVVYAYEKGDYFCLVGFHGRAQKPDFHYRYRKREQRDAKGHEHFASIRSREAFMIERRAKMNAQGHGLEVGAVLRCSWGYDQTNIDFFEVVKLIGRTMVEIREIDQASHGDWTGHCVPLPGKYKGEPMRKRAFDGSVRIYSFANAYLVKPEMVGGVPTYQPSAFTAYA